MSNIALSVPSPGSSSRSPHLQIAKRPVGRPRQPYPIAALDQLIHQSGPPHIDPRDRKGVTIEVSQSGVSLIVSEQTSSGGQLPRRILRERTFTADMELPNGDWVSVEVRHWLRSELPPEDGDLELAKDAHDDPIVLPTAPVTTAADTSQTAPQSKFVGVKADLLKFSGK